LLLKLVDVKKNFDKEVLARYLKGDYTSSDYQKVKSWFEEKELLDLDQFINQHWKNFDGKSEGKDLTFVLQKVQRRILLEDTTKKLVGKK
jgi:hypothetical protein